MKILEVTAIPPQIYAANGKDAQEQGIFNIAKGMLSYVLSGGADEKSLIVMSNPTPRRGSTTQLGTTGLDGVIHTVEVGTYWFEEDKSIEGHNTNYNEPMKLLIGVAEDPNLKGDLLGDLTAVGMRDNAINYWEVPDEYIAASSKTPRPHDLSNFNYSGVIPDVAGQLSVIMSKNIQGSITFTPPVPVFNNKARYCQSANITVFNPCSGARLTKNIFDLLPTGASPSSLSYNCAYSIGADIRPSGCPIFSWTYNNGGANQLTNLNETIKGGPWVKIPLTSNGLNGSYFQRLQRHESIVNGVVGLAGIAVGGALAGGVFQDYDYIDQHIADPTGFSEGYNERTPIAGTYKWRMAERYKGALLGGVGSYILSSIRQIQQQELLNRKSICATVPQFIGSNDFSNMVQGNKFAHCISSYSPEDMIDYDSFLTKFGYNVGNMMIGTQHFWSRKAFIYIKINDITISSPNAGQEMLDKVTEQLKAGVRIWRKKPNIIDMNPGGNREESTGPI